jgi:hypothetical protein
MRTLCIDFDGVIHSYKSGWKGATVIPDPPVEKAFSWLLEYMIAGFDVCVYSSRSKEPGAINAMRNWFLKYDFPVNQLDAMQFPTQKPAAYLTIDDRAVCFMGTFPSVERINAFKPWHKRPTWVEENVPNYNMSRVVKRDYELAEEALECLAISLTTERDGTTTFEPSATKYLASMFREAREAKFKAQDQKADE